MKNQLYLSMTMSSTTTARSLHLDENNYYTLCASDELQTCDPYSFAACEAAVPAGYVMHELRKDHTEDGFDKEPCAAEHENCQCTGYGKDLFTQKQSLQ